MGTFRLRCVAVLAFSILTVLPVTGTLCELLCASPMARSTHTTPAPHPDAPCHDADGSRTTLTPSAGHDCGRHEAVTSGPAAWLPAARATTIAPPTTSALSAPGFTDPGPHYPPAVLRGGPSGPPGGADSARPPLVLRI